MRIERLLFSSVCLELGVLERVVNCRGSVMQVTVSDNEFQSFIVGENCVVLAMETT